MTSCWQCRVIDMSPKMFSALVIEYAIKHGRTSRSQRFQHQPISPNGRIHEFAQWYFSTLKANQRALNINFLNPTGLKIRRNVLVISGCTHSLSTLCHCLYKWPSPLMAYTREIIGVFSVVIPTYCIGYCSLLPAEIYRRFDANAMRKCTGGSVMNTLLRLCLKLDIWLTHIYIRPLATLIVCKQL